MTARINRELGDTARRDTLMAIGVIILLVGTIVLGHNTIVSLRPAIIHQPVLNLLVGSALMLLGLRMWSVYRR